MCHDVKRLGRETTGGKAVLVISSCRQLNHGSWPKILDQRIKEGLELRPVPSTIRNLHRHQNRPFTDNARKLQGGTRGRGKSKPFRFFYFYAGAGPVPTPWVLSRICSEVSYSLRSFRTQILLVHVAILLSIRALDWRCKPWQASCVAKLDRGSASARI